MKRRMPPMPCARCGRMSSRRRDGRAVCLGCWVELSERKQDKEMRKMGKLKGSRGSPK